MFISSLGLCFLVSQFLLQKQFWVHMHKDNDAKSLNMEMKSICVKYFMISKHLHGLFMFITPEGRQKILKHTYSINTIISNANWTKSRKSRKHDVRITAYYGIGHKIEATELISDTARLDKWQDRVRSVLLQHFTWLS